MALFKGLSAFPITPADEYGRVDGDALRALIRRLVDAEVDSIGLLGSTGTYAYLARSERRRAIEAAVSEAAGRAPVMVGIGALRTDEAAQLGLDAKAAGADGALLAPVSYTPLTEGEVFTHFETVAGAVALPICIYNNPGTTHFTFTDALIGRLSRLPNVAAVKNPAPPAVDAAGAVAALRAVTAPGFSVGYSTDWGAAEAMLAGGDAWYSVLGGLFPKTCMTIRRAASSGDAEEARRLDLELAPLWDLFKRFSSLRVIYATANRLGLCRTSPPRPILPLPAEAQHDVAAVIDRLGFAA